ncbi:MAG: hypothetical protein IKE95_03735 [Methanobrevibacter sp.]|nr:hypothetical protein [Methanobrevibacter sp.]
MAKLSLAELQALVGSAVTTAKLSNDTFNVTRDNIVGLVDKIGKIHTIDTIYAIDKLAMFDGEYLSFGKTIEEWSADLILPEAFDPAGAGALAPHVSTFRPNFYSYTIGRKVIKQTLRNNDIERAVHFEEQMASIVAIMVKRIQDSMASYRYQVKREMLGKFIDLCEDEMDATQATAYATSTAYNVNAIVKNGSPAVVGIVVKPIANTNTDTWAQAIANGKIILLDLVTSIAKPTSTQTGEAFIKQVKVDVEVAQDLSEGHSLNGNTLGAVEGLVLVVKQGVIPSLEVDTYAGAFNEDRVVAPTEVVVVKDFGTADDKYYAVLMDRRAMRLHNTYDATRENFNGDGDFTNLFRHTEDTGAISRNCFIKVYKQPSA